MALVLSVIPRPCPRASLLPLATIQPLVQARVLRWLAGIKSIASVILVANDISFAIMTATTIGSAAHIAPLVSGSCYRDVHLLYACMVRGGSMRASLRTQ